MRFCKRVDPTEPVCFVVDQSPGAAGSFLVIVFCCVRLFLRRRPRCPPAAAAVACFAFSCIRLMGLFATSGPKLSCFIRSCCTYQIDVCAMPSTLVLCYQRPSCTIDVLSHAINAWILRPQVPRETLVMLIRLLHLLTPVRPHRLIQRTVLNLCAGHPVVRCDGFLNKLLSCCCLFLSSSTACLLPIPFFFLFFCSGQQLTFPFPFSPPL